MTDLELQAEWEYRLTEQLGLLCGDRQETYAQWLIAKAEADAAILALRNQERDQQELW